MTRAFLLAALAACWTGSTEPVVTPTEPAKPNPCAGCKVRPVQPVYSVSAQTNYEKGRAALEETKLELAAKYFTFIRSRFPYSQYAKLAVAALTDAREDYATRRRACDVTCRRCAATCTTDVAESKCPEICAERFPDGANLPPIGP